MPEQLDLSGVSTADLAAIKARSEWIEYATAGDRGGKQLLPDGKWNILLIRAGRGFGKLLSLETIVPTPSGWSTMGALRVGDRVFDERGQVCRVTWVSPVQYDETYNLTFGDGASIIAGASHEWVTWTHRDRKEFLRDKRHVGGFPNEWWRWKHPRNGAGPTIKTTDQIVSTIKQGARGDRNHCVPTCGALCLPAADLPIAPYTLGYWLGNGGVGSGMVTCHEQDRPDVMRRIEEDGFMCSPHASPQNFGVLGLQAALRKAGLLRAKKLPLEYLRASEKQRADLLAGLMDSDGGVEATATVSFTNTEKSLTDAVEELAVSLGMRGTMDDRIPYFNGVAHKRAYRFVFTANRQVFTTSRKSGALKLDGKEQQLRRYHRMIVSAERVSPVPMCCIMVDSPSRMYLIGRGMIPTHNSRALSEAAWWEAWRAPGIIVHYLAPTGGDVRGTAFEGPSGLLSVIPQECLYGGATEYAYNRTTREVRLAQGSLIKGFATTEEGERLRGPQCHFLVGDELAAWDRPAGNLESAFNNAMLGCRLPYPDRTPARAMFGTTPRPIPFLRRLENRADVIVVRGSTYENLANLSGNFLTTVMTLEGTQAGKQEIYGDYIDSSEFGIFQRKWFRLFPRGRKVPEFAFVIESYDTAFKEEDVNVTRQKSDFTACTVWGVFNIKAVFSKDEQKALGIFSNTDKPRFGALLCESWHERIGFPDLLKKARDQHRIRWGTPGRKADVVLIEQKGSGISLRQSLLEYGVPTWPYNPGQQSKTMRAHACAPLILQGACFIPESTIAGREGMPRDWAEPLLEQVCDFAGRGSTEHDDYVDSLSSALLYLQTRGMLSVVPETIDLDPEDTRELALAAARKVEESNRPRGNPYSM